MSGRVINGVTNGVIKLAVQGGAIIPTSNCAERSFSQSLHQSLFERSHDQSAIALSDRTQRSH